MFFEKLYQNLPVFLSAGTVFCRWIAIRNRISKFIFNLFILSKIVFNKFGLALSDLLLGLISDDNDVL